MYVFTCVRVYLAILLASMVPLAKSSGEWRVASAASPVTRHASPVADYALVAENELFELHANEATLAFRVVDKRSGYVWQSNLEEVTEDDDLNRTWTAFATSGISIDYLDEKAVDKRASITNAEHTIDFRRTPQGFEASVTFVEVSISLLVRVELEPSGVRVEVPFESISEGGDFKLGLLYVYPFFGATREDEVTGYMFIPDGAGSLIRFAATTKAQNIFYGRYYADDLGMLGELPYDPTLNRPYRLSLPVSGMVHGERQNAFISIVEKGAAYGELQAHPAGVTTKFNFLHTAFIYNESYFQATNRAGAGVTTLQPSPNAFDITIHYRFLTGPESDYVGMARSYQQYLREKGMLADAAVGPGDDIGIRLEFLGGEKERILFWPRFIPMTTVSQMASILEGLDVRNPEVIYYGWQPLGATAMPPRTLKLERGLGSLNELKALAQSIADRGGNFYLYLDPQAALVDEGGYSPRNDLALAITSVNLRGANRNKLNYYLNLRAIRDRYARLSEGVFSELEAPVGLALDGIGSTLYSDFRRGSFLGRDEAIREYQALLAEHPGRTAFYMPNDYVFGFMQAYYDIPLSNSGYLYATEAAPFLQIVLAGYIPTYGPALNFSSNLQADLLRHVDFNVYPSYFLSHDPTSKILRTSSNWIYSSAYSQWAPEIERTYQWLNNLLGPVRGEQIVAREALAEDVMATTYSNGQQIIVNYGGQPFRADATLVNAQDAVIREVQP
jgi:hypothetical protein